MQELLKFMERYTGKSAPLLLKRQLEKTGIKELQNASDVQLMNLTDSIVHDILTPLLSKGRLPLIRSELIGVLGINVDSTGIPTVVDGVRVLPDSIKEDSAEHFKTISDFILRQEMTKYGLKDLSKAESATRLAILRAFVGYHFGSSGKAILERKMAELNVRDVLKAPAYDKILLMEFILQDMLLFYVEPLKARMLRSELVTVLDVDLELVQGPGPDVEKAAREVSGARRYVRLDASKERAVDFEDLIAFNVKRGLSARDIADARAAAQDVRNGVASEVLSGLMGGMTGYVFTRLETGDENIKTKFMLRYLRNYLNGLMLPGEVENVCGRLTRELALQA